MENLRDRLQPLIAPIVEKFSAEFLELEIKGSKNNVVVRVIVDAEGGVGVETCAAISRALADELDMADAISSRYRLEVSSPGVDRPLRTLRDFQRNVGREARVRHRQGDAFIETEGTIQSVSENGIVLAALEEALDIAFADIDAGKIKMKW
jgi:ribosome maturation factor RimP